MLFLSNLFFVKQHRQHIRKKDKIDAQIAKNAFAIRLHMIRDQIVRVDISRDVIVDKNADYLNDPDLLNIKNNINVKIIKAGFIVLLNRSNIKNKGIIMWSDEKALLRR